MAESDVSDNGTNIVPTNDGGEDAGRTQDNAVAEAEARRMGWRPKEEFRGNPDRWVDAETYLERGKEVLPIIKAENQALRLELERIKQDAAAVVEVVEKAREREVAELNAELVRARQERKEAITSADGDGFDAADKEVAELEAKLAEAKAKKAAPKQADTAGFEARFTAWSKLPGNEWIDKDVVLTMNAMARHSDFATLRAGNDPEAYWTAVAERVKSLQSGEAPRKDLNRPGPSPTKGGSGDSRGGGRSYANLLPEFKQACDRQYKDFGIKMKQEDWRSRYVAQCGDDCFR